MNRKSLAMQAGVAQATQVFIKEIQRLRKEHGFGDVEVEVNSPLIGTSNVSIEIHSETEYEFDDRGEFIASGDEFEEKKISEFAAGEP